MVRELIERRRARAPSRMDGHRAGRPRPRRRPPVAGAAARGRRRSSPTSGTATARAGASTTTACASRARAERRAGGRDRSGRRHEPPPRRRRRPAGCRVRGRAASAAPVSGLALARLVIPYAVVLLLLAGTAIAYAIEEPDPSDRRLPLARPAPTDIGGQRLAERAAPPGASRSSGRPAPPTRSSSAHRGDATLFVPAPDLVHPYYLRMLSLMPASTPVVLVDPSDGDAGRAATCSRPVGRRPLGGATVAAPGCATDPRRRGRRRPAALRTAVLERAACASLTAATAASLLRAASRGHDADAGRRQPTRSATTGSASTATPRSPPGLLADPPRVVWLDLHQRGARPDATRDERRPRRAPGAGRPRRRLAATRDFPSARPGRHATPGETGRAGRRPASRRRRRRTTPSLADLFPAVALDGARPARAGRACSPPLPGPAGSARRWPSRCRCWCRRPRPSPAAAGSTSAPATAARRWACCARAARDRITHAARPAARR